MLMVGGLRIARVIEFQMTGAVERKERETKLVVDKKVLVRGAKRMDRLMITNVQSEILRRVCTEGFICNGGKFDDYMIF